MDGNIISLQNLKEIQAMTHITMPDFSIRYNCTLGTYQLSLDNEWFSVKDLVEKELQEYPLPQDIREIITEKILLKLKNPKEKK